jgi:DNA-binding transcriptional LysR family regulator
MMMSLGIDPADLLALHLLLEERHVTRAAKKLGVTQSTMSHRLAKLRSDLGDELLVQDGSDMVLTARAREMSGPLSDAVAALRAALLPASAFDPKRAQFEATIALPDILTLLLPRLSAFLKEEAPGLLLNVRSLPGDLSEVLGGENRPLVIAPEQFANQAAQVKRIGLLKFGVFFRKGHPLSRGKLTVKRWLSHPHVVVSIQNPQSNRISLELEKRGHSRKIGLVVPGFLAGLLVVAESDLVMNAPISMAKEVTTRLGLIARPMPLPIEPVQLSLLWHGRDQSDPAHSWLRGRVHSFLQKEFKARGALG